MPTMDQLLSRVVERKGYTVQGADATGLLARKGDDALLVAWKTDGPITASDAQLFTTAMEQVRALSGILVAPKGCEQSVKDHAASMKTLEIWAESRLVVEVGDALVKDALGTPGASPTPYTANPMQAPAAPAPAPARANAAIAPGQSLIARAATAASGDGRGAAMYMTNKARTITPEPTTLNYAWGGAPAGITVDPGVAQIRNGRKPATSRASAALAAAPGDVEIVETPRRAQAAPATPPSSIIVPENDDVELISTPRRAPAAPAPAPMPAPTAAPADEDAYEIIVTPKKGAAQPAAANAGATQAPAAGDVLRLALARSDAETKAAAKVGAAKNARLTLVPHVTFEYDARVERKELPEPLTGKGALLINSLTGEMRNFVDITTGEAPADSKREVPKLQAADVYDKVKSHLTKTFTREMRVEREVGGVDVFENVRVNPGLEELGLNHRGILYVPVWEVTGANGTAKVDAHTGDLL